MLRALLCMQAACIATHAWLVSLFVLWERFWAHPVQQCNNSPMCFLRLPMLFPQAAMGEVEAGPLRSLISEGASLGSSRRFSGMGWGPQGSLPQSSLERAARGTSGSQASAHGLSNQPLGHGFMTSKDDLMPLASPFSHASSIPAGSHPMMLQRSPSNSGVPSLGQPTPQGQALPSVGSLTSQPSVTRPITPRLTSSDAAAAQQQFCLMPSQQGVAALASSAAARARLASKGASAANGPLFGSQLQPPVVAMIQASGPSMGLSGATAGGSAVGPASGAGAPASASASSLPAGTPQGSAYKHGKEPLPPLAQATGVSGQQYPGLNLLATRLAVADAKAKGSVGAGAGGASTTGSAPPPSSFLMSGGLSSTGIAGLGSVGPPLVSSHQLPRRMGTNQEGHSGAAQAGEIEALPIAPAGPSAAGSRPHSVNQSYEEAPPVVLSKSSRQSRQSRASQGYPGLGGSSQQQPQPQHQGSRRAAGLLDPCHAGPLRPLPMQGCSQGPALTNHHLMLIPFILKVRGSSLSHQNLGDRAYLCSLVDHAGQPCSSFFINDRPGLPTGPETGSKRHKRGRRITSSRIFGAALGGGGGGRETPATSQSGNLPSFALLPTVTSKRMSLGASDLPSGPPQQGLYQAGQELGGSAAQGGVEAGPGAARGRLPGQPPLGHCGRMRATAPAAALVAAAAVGAAAGSSAAGTSSQGTSPCSSQPQSPAIQAAAPRFMAGLQNSMRRMSLHLQPGAAAAPDFGIEEAGAQGQAGVEATVSRLRGLSMSCIMGGRHGSLLAPGLGRPHLPSLLGRPPQHLLKEVQPMQPGPLLVNRRSMEHRVVTAEPRETTSAHAVPPRALRSMPDLEETSDGSVGLSHAAAPYAQPVSVQEVGPIRHVSNNFASALLNWRTGSNNRNQPQGVASSSAAPSIAEESYEAPPTPQLLAAPRPSHMLVSLHDLIEAGGHARVE